MIEELKETVCQISERTYNEVTLASRAKKPYEFPNGYNTVFDTERYRITETYFDPARYILGVNKNFKIMAGFFQAN